LEHIENMRASQGMGSGRSGEAGDLRTVALAS
jgi:hypothetical protein